MSSKNKVRLIASQLSSLREQLEISREILNSASKEVEQLYSKNNKNRISTKEKSKSEKFKKKPNSDSDAAQNESCESTPDAKSVYRKIAMRTHPDKLSKDLSGSQIEKKEKIFREATAAIENNDIISLYDIAIKQGIEVPEISEKDIENAENKIKAIKKEINFIESTLAWKWHFAKTKEAKDEILKNMFDLMNEH